GINRVGSNSDTNNASGLTDISHTLSVDLDKLQKQQHDDDCLSKVFSWIENNEARPPIGHLKHSSPVLRKLWQEYPKLTIRQGILCRKTKTSPYTPDTFQVVLPVALIPTALVALH
ncbi:regulator of microtubule dynamics 1 isoform X1, partial [Clarias magur]